MCMLMTRYLNTLYYKTELIYNNNIVKINKKKEKKMVENESVNNNGLSLGIAVGLGFLGAIVAVKNKLI